MSSITKRNRMNRMLEILVRIPPLIVMDSLLNKTMLSRWFPVESINLLPWPDYFIWFCLSVLLFILGFMIFCLEKNHITQVYSYSSTLGILMVSYYWNLDFVQKVHNMEVLEYSAKPRDFLEIIILKPTDYFRGLLLQIILAFTFVFLRSDRKTYQRFSNTGKFLQQTIVYISFTLPYTIRAFYVDLRIFLLTYFLSVILPVVHVQHDLLCAYRDIVFVLKRGYTIMTNSIIALGIQGYLEHQWVRLHTPQVLRLFGVSRVFYFLAVIPVMKFYNPETVPELKSLEDSEASTTVDMFTDIIKFVLTRSCENFIALLGLTSIVSFITHYVGIFMASCVGSDAEDDRNMGTVSAILFFILALQTGLTGLDSEKRLLRLYKNFMLLSTAILHFVHSMVHPILMSLSASRNTSITRHARALGMCLFLIFFPTTLIIVLWSKYSISTWLLAVSAFSIEVVVKVIVSLTVYGLFMYDAYRNKFWEKLDDYVYYVQSTGNTIEFLFGIFLFCNGAWIMLFESGGAIRACMMCIHAYFNIFVQAIEGWKIFMKRQTAAKKIQSLAIATQEQLDELNDVCAICYQELQTARRTKCNHFFHSACLRKWLYVQDNCPLCHNLIYEPEKETSDQEDSMTNIPQNNNVNLNGGLQIQQPHID